MRIGNRYRHYKKYKEGVWKARCPFTGIVYYSNQFSERYDGQLVGPDVEKARHPQELLEVTPEAPLDWTRPVPTDVFNTEFCTGNSRVGQAGYAGADCWVVELSIPLVPVI